MAFLREEQKKAGVEVSQAPAMLHSHLTAIIAHMTLRIRCTHDPYDRIVLARDIALFTVAFSTLKRGDGLSRARIQRILRLPNECGFLLNFQWGKMMRDGADHLMTVEYDIKRMTTCPIRAIEQYIAVGTALGWNMTQGYLFPRISRRPNTGAPIRGGRRLYQHQIRQRRSNYTRVTPGNAPRSPCTPSDQEEHLHGHWQGRTCLR